MRDGFGQFCPIATACEVFTKRWTPIVLRELFAGSHRFNEIHRCIPLMSRALLARRLRELQSAGIVSALPGTGGGRGGGGLEYRLTESGKDFKPALDALGTWGQRWTIRVDPHNLDAGLLMWNMRRRVDRERLPPQRVVVMLTFGGVAANYRGARQFWLVLDPQAPQAAEVCLHDPGHDIDLVVEADTAAMVKVWLGDSTFAEALRERSVVIRGEAALARRFPEWFLLSHFSGVVRVVPKAALP